MKKAAVTHDAAPVMEVTQGSQGLSIDSLMHSPDTWIVLSFVLFMALMIKFLVPTIVKGLDARAEKIRDQLEQASRLRAEAEALLASYQEKQQTMLKEAETIIATAKRDAEEMRLRAAEDLKLSLERRTQQAREKIERAEAEAISTIRTRIIETATESARTMLAEQAPGAADEAAIARAIAAISQQIH